MSKKENTVTTLERVFQYGAMKLDDPGAQFSPADVRDYYAPHFPKLTGAAIKGPKVEGNKEIWEFVTQTGTKG